MRVRSSTASHSRLLAVPPTREGNGLQPALVAVGRRSSVGLFAQSCDAVLGQISGAARAIGTDHFGVPVPTDDKLVSHVAWRVGLVMSALAGTCRRNPTFHVVEHEQTCADPVGRFRELVQSVGLTWTPDTEAFVVDSDKPGAGWDTNRLASDKNQRWRTRLPGAMLIPPAKCSNSSLSLPATNSIVTCDTHQSVGASKLTVRGLRDA